MPPRKLRVTLTETGRLDDGCPHCGQILNKRPERKAACPHCKQFIFVRTRPIDRQRVLVTEEEANLLENEWANFPRPTISLFLDNEKMQKCREQLAEKLGCAPSDEDVALTHLNQEMMNHAKRRDWGLYRNTKLSVAALLERNQKPEKALRFYFEVCYLDLNGPQNTGGVNDPALRTSLNVQDFNLKDAWLAPALVDKILELILILRHNEAQVYKDFMSVAEIASRNLKLPVLPQKAWDEISAGIYI